MEITGTHFQGSVRTLCENSLLPKGRVACDPVADHINREGWRAVGARLRCARDVVAEPKGPSVSAVRTPVNDKS